MTRKRTAALLITAAVGLLCAAGPAAAEWSWELYGGAAWIQSADLKVRGEGTDGASANLTIFDIDIDTGFTVGTGAGYWFESAPFLGLGLDVFYLQAPVPAQTRTGTGALTGEFLGKPISVSVSGVASIPSATLPMLGFAPELRLRWPLMVDSTFRHGRWQPYLAAGPSWAFSLDDDDLAVQLGGKVGTGLAFQITPLIAVIAEYRYIFYPDFELTTEHLTYSGDVKTHSVIGGISLRF
jgi:opacity protein-like surface antigen